MRPTVPIGDWRVAVDLVATSSIQNQPGTPAFGCGCTWCENWRLAWSSVLPVDLIQQLRRLRIDLSHPTELYASHEVPGGAFCRVTFHAVGKVLSGPSIWKEDPRVGRTPSYTMIRPPPSEIWLLVASGREVFDPVPEQAGVKKGQLLQVDFRLFVPAAKAAGVQPPSGAERGADAPGHCPGPRAV